MSKEQLHVISVQPYGYIDGPDDQGSGAQGSRARIDEALIILESLVSLHHVVFVFPQGYGAENPSVPGNKPVSLGESMARYIESQLHLKHPGVKVVFEPLTWGTMSDIKMVPHMVHKYCGVDTAHVHFVTDPTHLKRVRLVWKYVRPAGWSTSFHPAKKHRMTWKERYIREPIARMRYRYLLWRES